MDGIALLNWFDKNEFLLDKESRKNISYISNIEIKPFFSKGDKNKIRYFWFCNFKNKKTRLNFVRKFSTPIPIKVYCKQCDKLIFDNYLSKFLSLKRAETIENIKDYNTVKFCKLCATKLNAINGQKKSRQTCKEKYGVEHVFNIPGYKEKAKKSLIKKYGKDWAKKIAKKAKLTFYKKTGYWHNSFVPNVRENMDRKRKETINKMSNERKRLWSQRRFESYDKKNSPGFFGNNYKKKNYKSSKIADEFIKNIVKKLKLKKQNYFLEYPHKGYLIDLFIFKKCAIEFYGDFWHANPKIYKENDILKHFEKTEEIKVKNIWKKDKKRIKFLKKELKINFFIVWENSYKKNKEKILLDICKRICKIKNNDKPRTYFY